MDLANALKDIPAIDAGPSCTVAATLKALPDKDAEALRAALEDERWRASDLSRVLATEGIHLSGYTLSRHRRGICKCSRLGNP